MRTFILMLFAFSIPFAYAADDEGTTDVRKLMAPEDFEASGLDKLTDAEREHLSEWVGKYREGAVSGPPVSRKPLSQQTKEERVNLVYAVKVIVNNDGSLKIGMPGEVNFKR